MTVLPNLNSQHVLEHTQLLLWSFHRITGKALLDESIPASEHPYALFQAPFAVVSHDTQSAPVFNYGNQAALSLFELCWADFTELESRYSAEPKTQQERDELLTRVSQYGFIDDYTGVRISSTGRRFFVEDALVWNLIDQSNTYRGQAAVLYRWRWL